MSAWQWLWTIMVWGSMAWYAVLVGVLGVLGVRDALQLLRKIRDGGS